MSSSTLAFKHLRAIFTVAVFFNLFRGSSYFRDTSLRGVHRPNVASSLHVDEKLGDNDTACEACLGMFHCLSL
jgi:hypothetical protein